MNTSCTLKTRYSRKGLVCPRLLKNLPGKQTHWNPEGSNSELMKQLVLSSSRNGL